MAACFASFACLVLSPATCEEKIRVQPDPRNEEAHGRQSYLECLLLAQQDILDPLIDLLGASIRIGNLVSSADLVPQLPLEFGLRFLVQLNLLPQFPARDIDLSLNPRITRTGGLLDPLHLIPEMAKSIIDVVLDVIQSLTGGLVFLSGAGI